MKIRNGFVSNSSSSSFVIFGIETKTEKINPLLLKQKTYTVTGSYLEEGLDVFDLTEESLAFIKACETLYGWSPFTIYENFGEGNIDLSTLPRTGIAKLIGGEAAQGSSYDLSYLFENYCGEDCEDSNFDSKKIQIEMEKHMRKEKLIKIIDEQRIH